MKNHTFKLMPPILFLVVFFIASCYGNKSGKEDHITQRQNDGVVYACPKHPELIGEEGGQCPKCKMHLQADE